jgi:hypothetical protein
MSYIEKIFASRKERQHFLAEIHDDYCRQDFYTRYYTDISSDGENFKKVSDCYFLLNGIYKKHKIKSGHHTKYTKIAALTMIASFLVHPFHGGEHVASFVPKANFDFALILGSGILDLDLEIEFSKTQLDRLYDFFLGLKVNFIQDYLSKGLAFSEDLITQYELSFEEMRDLGSFITILELITSLKDPKKS